MKKLFKKIKPATVLSFVYLVISVLALFVVVKINILPTKYLILLSLFLLVLPIILLIVQNKLSKKSNVTKHKKLKKILNIYSFVMSLILLVITVYIAKTNKFLETLSSSGYEIKNYSVMVLKNSGYEKIEDIANKELGYIDSEDESVAMANTEIEDIVDINLSPRDDLSTLTQDLTDKKLDAIMIEDTYKNILDEEDTEFMDTVKVIYTFSIQVPVDDISVDVSLEEPFNIYISGIDTYGKIESVSRSDVNIVATINPKTHQVLLTNIPRDSYVQLYNTTGFKDKLTHAGIYGIGKSVKTVEELLDIEINYYVKVNFTSVEDIVDALGGITVYSKYTFTSYIGNYYFVEGYNNMNGAQALGFARERKSFADGDIARGQNQQAVIEALIRKASSPAIITKYSSILNSMASKFETNMPIEKIQEFIKMQIDSPEKWTVTSITLSGSGSSEYTYSAGRQKLSVVILDEETIKEAKVKIDLVMAGEKLKSSYGEVTNPRNTTQSSTSTNNNNSSSTNSSKNSDTKKQDELDKKESESKEEIDEDIDSTTNDDEDSIITIY